MAQRVVITGIGPVTSAGIGSKAFFDRIRSQSVTPQPIPQSFMRSYCFHSRWYLPAPPVSFSELGLDVMHEKAMHPEDRMVVLGAKLAFEDAGWDVVSRAGRFIVDGLEGDTGVLLGTGLSGLQTVCESYLVHCLPQDVLRSALPHRRPVFSRMGVPKTMPNSPAAWASICFGLTGGSSTVNAACASGTCAVGEAYRRIKDGYSQVILTRRGGILPD